MRLDYLIYCGMLTAIPLLGVAAGCRVWGPDSDRARTIWAVAASISAVLSLPTLGYVLAYSLLLLWVRAAGIEADSSLGPPFMMQAILYSVFIGVPATLSSISLFFRPPAHYSGRAKRRLRVLALLAGGVIVWGKFLMG